MRLYFTCNNCGKDNHFYSKVPDRTKLAGQVQLYIKRECKYCKNHNKVHINRIYAKESKRFVLPVLFIGIIITITLVVFLMKTYWRNDIGRDLYALSAFGIALAVPLLIMFTFLSNHSKKVQSFNAHRV